MKPYSICLLATLQLGLLSSAAQESAAPGASTSQQQPSQPLVVSAAAAPLRDGAHDFDFLIGNWKAHVRRLPDRLVGSSTWVEYDGISNHKKILDSNANFEEFEVDNPEKHLHIKAQTLRLYNPDSQTTVKKYESTTSLRESKIRLPRSRARAPKGFASGQRNRRGDCGHAR